jgi:hypothetical protein
VSTLSWLSGLGPMESRGVSPRQQIEAALAKMAELGRLAASMVASVPPPTVPKPPPPPPQRKLTWDDRCGWHIPSNLSQAELASTEPSEHRMRAARDKFEAEARQQAQQRPGLPPNFKVDPITGRFVIK